MKRLAVLILLSFAGAAAPAWADDTVVTTVPRATTIDAYGGRAIWSTWDPAAAAYRLTVDNDGRTRTLPVAPSKEPFEVDLGPGPHGGTVATYQRCRRPLDLTVDREGRRGCDLYLYRFTTGRETRLVRAASRADEHWPAVWGNRLAFVRTYRTGERALYWRPLTGKGASHRLRIGPSNLGGGAPQELDIRGRRVAFVLQYEFSADLRLTIAGGRGRLLVRMPGSGAAAFSLTAQGPTVGRRVVDWALSVGQDVPVYSEIRRVDLATRKEQRATVRIDGPADVNRATTGFAHDGGAAWYVRAAAPDRYEVHVARGLHYEPAPPPELPG